MKIGRQIQLKGKAVSKWPWHWRHRIPVSAWNSKGVPGLLFCAPVSTAMVKEVLGRRKKSEANEAYSKLGFPTSWPSLEKFLASGASNGQGHMTVSPFYTLEISVRGADSILLSLFLSLLPPFLLSFFLPFFHWLGEFQWLLLFK